ncbi:MAG: CoA-transferase [Micromonosporaceae bacterium]|nr:CoA-transferase [Micromonosporaceae bacterium]
MSPAPADRAEICVVACAEAFRGNGEILGAPIGIVPIIGARLARATFEPDLLLTDGEAHLVYGTWPVGEPPSGATEGWLPYRAVFDVVWSGRRHVIMTPSQIDSYGNTNISAIGDYARPTVQLLGVRGAPGNAVSHPTSYWVPKHSRRVFVPRVDSVSGVGWDNARKAGPAATEFMDLRVVITDLGVFDWETETRQMRIRSVHPGVTVDEVLAATGFPLIVGDEVPTTREPDETELRLIREVIDPHGARYREVKV